MGSRSVGQRIMGFTCDESCFLGDSAVPWGCEALDLGQRATVVLSVLPYFPALWIMNSFCGWVLYVGVRW